MEEKILYKKESYKIIGACMKVHRGLGPGFLESVYEAVKYVPVAFYSQLNNYLAATRKELGILVNFGTTSLTYKRIINTTHSR